MAVLKDFYQVNSIEHQNGAKYLVKIHLNKDHDIFKGHFPGNPVTPGVCMMQIIKDITEEITAKKLFLSSANNVKFMAIINPDETPALNLEMDITQDSENVKVKNVTNFGETIALKMSVNYKIIAK